MNRAAPASADHQDLVAPDDAYVLDNAAWLSLTGAHARLGARLAGAARYAPDVSPFAALALDPDGAAWHDLAALLGRDGTALVPGLRAEAPAGWQVLSRGEGVQMIDTHVQAAEYPDVLRLRPQDVPEMLDLAARTKPGPFLSRTIEMGTYLGIRRDGRLIAMAGERLRPPGWTEISAVCTDAGYRGHGLATRLVQAVVADIRAGGGTPFLHAVATNVTAIRLYESMGFTLRRTTEFRSVRAPG
jgi:ribosomal protein S18 acetylase RimI-like enzyme